MSRLTCKTSSAILFLLLAVVIAATNAHAVQHRYFEYFEGLPPYYQEPEWQGYNYHASDPIDSGTELTLYGYPKEISGQRYTCVGWKDASGSVTPAEGDINRVTFDLRADSSITWIYREAHKVSFEVSGLVQSLSTWGKNDWGELGTGIQTPEGWIRYDATGHEYALTDPMTWQDAEAYAVSQGGHLVTINDHAENAWLALVFPEETENLWIGFHQNPSDCEPSCGWHWASGEAVTYTRWNSGEPNDYGSDHATMWQGHGGFWNDDFGESRQYRGIMERHAQRPTPAQVGADTDWIAVTAGSDHTVALKQNGTLWAWGDNTYGQLGDGTTSERSTSKGVGAFSAGAVTSLYGDNSGLSAAGNQFWHQDSPDIGGGAETSDFFGEVVASGDFNGDGYSDLAVGVPGESIGDLNNAGAVNVLYGSVGGLSAAGNQMWHQDSPEIGGGAETNDQFGAALSSGDFNNDGYWDLAIGVPGETSGLAAGSAGVVHVLYGSDTGLTATGNQIWLQGDGIGGQHENGDRFGAVLSSGDFNNDGYWDLAVGAPGENGNAGAVNVIYGSAGGLTAADNQLWVQEETLFGTVPEPGDLFGSALATGDVNGDGFADLAIGVPGENGYGVVHLLYGSATGLSATGISKCGTRTVSTSRVRPRSMTSSVQL